MFDWFACEWRWLHLLSSTWMFYFAGITNDDHGFTTEQAEFFTSFLAYSSEERSQAVIVSLTVTLKRMVMALSALETKAKEYL